MRGFFPMCPENGNTTYLCLCVCYRISFAHVSYSGERMCQIFQMYVLSFMGNKMAQPLNSAGWMTDLCYVMVLLLKRFCKYLLENVMNCIISCVLDFKWILWGSGCFKQGTVFRVD